MIVREAEEKDLPALTIIGERIQGFTPATELPFYLDSLGFELYVLEEENTPIAFCCVRLEEDDEAEIDDIAISESQQGQGKATFFLKELLNAFALDGIKKIFLEVRSQNAKAISLYERNGFVRYRERKHYYPDDDALCYLWEAKSK